MHRLRTRLVELEGAMAAEIAGPDTSLRLTRDTLSICAAFQPLRPCVQYVITFALCWISVMGVTVASAQWKLHAGHIRTTGRPVDAPLRGASRGALLEAEVEAPRRGSPRTVQQNPSPGTDIFENPLFPFNSSAHSAGPRSSGHLDADMSRASAEG